MNNWHLSKVIFSLNLKRLFFVYIGITLLSSLLLYANTIPSFTQRTSTIQVKIVDSSILENLLKAKKRKQADKEKYVRLL